MVAMELVLQSEYCSSMAKEDWCHLFYDKKILPILANRFPETEILKYDTGSDDGCVKFIISIVTDKTRCFVEGIGEYVVKVLEHIVDFCVSVVPVAV